MPKVSIILTSFNHAKYLRDAIESVLNQTFEDFELIIWDDASTDDSWEIIESYKDSRIIALRNNVQRRGVYNINKAINEIVRAEYIAIHHSDDVWEPQKLDKQVAFLEENRNTGAVFTKAHIIDERGNPFTDESHFYFKIFDQPNRTRWGWLRFFFERGNALCHPSVLIRKQCYEDCGLYRYGLGQLGDFDMWIRLTLKYEIYILPEKLVGFRVRDNEANSSGNRPVTHSRGLYEYSLIIYNYLKIDDLEDLISVFPEAKKYCNGEKPLLHYALAMAMLEIKPNYFTIKYALDILFHIVNDSKLKDFVKFDGRDFIKLTGELDPLQILLIENLKQFVNERDLQITQLRQSLSESENQINQIMALFQHVDRIESKIFEVDLKPQNLAGQIKKLIETVNRNDELISNMRESFLELDAQINKISVETQSLGILESRLLDIEPEFENLARQVKNLSNAVSARDNQISVLNQQVTHYKNAIDSFHQSNYWKIARPFWRLKQSFSAKMSKTNI